MENIDYKQKLQTVFQILDKAEELNLGNYSNYQVELLNNTFIEAYLFIQRVLVESENEGNIKKSKEELFKELQDKNVIISNLHKYIDNQNKLIKTPMFKIKYFVGFLLNKAKQKVKNKTYSTNTSIFGIEAEIEKYIIETRGYLNPRIKETLSKIINQLESCNYECKGGFLQNNVAFQALKKMTNKNF